ncbi:hypothetical protein BDZ89DRAFT_1050052 [Hymenopellis radicata]|nr:hypothetical protein BDZ89DRAFT_1050052 [Hymenopellis radicata]
MLKLRQTGLSQDSSQLDRRLDPAGPVEELQTRAISTAVAHAWDYAAATCMFNFVFLCPAHAAPTLSYLRLLVFWCDFQGGAGWGSASRLEGIIKDCVLTDHQHTSNLAQCLSTLLTWTGTTGNVQLFITSGDAPSGHTIHDLRTQSGTSFTYVVAEPNSRLVSNIGTSTGAIFQTETGIVTVTTGGNTDCLNLYNVASSDSGSSTTTSAARALDLLPLPPPPRPLPRSPRARPTSLSHITVRLGKPNGEHERHESHLRSHLSTTLTHVSVPRLPALECKSIPLLSAVIFSAEAGSLPFAVAQSFFTIDIS